MVFLLQFFDLLLEPTDHLMELLFDLEFSSRFVLRPFFHTKSIVFQPPWMCKNKICLCTRQVEHVFELLVVPDFFAFLEKLRIVASEVQH